MRETSRIEKVEIPGRHIFRILPDILYGIAFTGAFFVMCWYLFGVCDLAYVNF